METIRLYQGTDEVAPLRLCDHLALKYDDPISVPGEETLSLQNVKCPNCGGWMCERCQDDAVRCAGGVCVDRICAECQATARKRGVIIDSLGAAFIDIKARFDYLCAPCCTRQDEAALKLQADLREVITWQPIDTAPKHGKLIIGFAITDTETGNWKMRIMSHMKNYAGDKSEWNGWGDSWIPPTHWMPLPKPPAAIPSALDEILEALDSATGKAREAL